MKSENKEMSFKKLPAHIGFIMDGNGRWAKKRLLPRKAGHKKGIDTIEKVTDVVFDLGIPFISLYAFSTENKNRPKEEVDSLFSLMRDYFDKSLKKYIEDQISLRFMGDTTYFPEDLQESIANAKEKTKQFTKKTLNFGLNYGSRSEIVRAVNLAVQKNLKVDEDSFESLLYTDGMPGLDLIIRTGGEQRLSNFMLYQSAYSELFFTDTLWPDFNKKQIYAAIEKYSNTNRRFGKIEE